MFFICEYPRSSAAQMTFGTSSQVSAFGVQSAPRRISALAAGGAFCSHRPRMFPRGFPSEAAQAGGRGASARAMPARGRRFAGKSRRLSGRGSRSSVGDAPRSASRARSSGAGARSSASRARSSGNGARRSADERRWSGSGARWSGHEIRQSGSGSRFSGNDFRSTRKHFYLSHRERLTLSARSDTKNP
jgi:hypothetical protein